MASCAYCDTTILFGGRRQGNLRFCNAQCEQRGAVAQAANQLPAEEVARYLGEVHRGNCPRCKGAGPVDVHTSYRVWSALLMTSWSSRPIVSCQPCGTKRKLGDAVFSVLLGWWGFPWGIVMTPVQVGRNLFGLTQRPHPTVPSASLEKMVRLQLANHRRQARGPPSRR